MFDEMKPILGRNRNHCLKRFHFHHQRDVRLHITR